MSDDKKPVGKFVTVFTEEQYQKAVAAGHTIIDRRRDTKTELAGKEQEYDYNAKTGALRPKGGDEQEFGDLVDPDDLDDMEIEGNA